MLSPKEFLVLLSIASFAALASANEISDSHIDAFAAEKIAIAYQKGYELAIQANGKELAARHKAKYESVTVSETVEGNWVVSIPRKVNVHPCCFTYLVSGSNGEITFIPGK